MNEAYDVRSAEAQATTEMQRQIGCHLSYLDRCYRLLDLAIGHYDESETRVGSVDYVALLLFGRIANDVRAIWTLARLGYGAQACTLAASVFEHAFTFVDTIIDEEKAAKWTGHADPRHSFLPAKQAINKFIDRMPWSSDQKIKAKDSQCLIYQELCQFKHGNPRSIFPRVPSDAGYWDNRLGPDTTNFWVCSASVAVLHAVWCAGLTLQQWVDARPLPRQSA